MYLFLLSAAAAEPAAVHARTHSHADTLILVAIAQKNDEESGDKQSARANLFYNAVDTTATAATHDEQYDKQVQIVIVTT